MKRKLIYSLLLSSFAVSLAAQETPQIIKGRVVDVGGEPIIGAHVRWKDSKGGAVTDLDGNFSLPGFGKSFTISYLSYKTTSVSVKKEKNFYRVILEDDAQNLDELVVVGYGTQKKASLTGSVEVIKSEDLLTMPTANLDEALYGQVAGLQVMQTSGDPSSAREANLHIRGINNSPLLVIDGVPRFGTTTTDGEMRLSDLNPDDIESVSILKDAAAAAVYGARAANGVILVKTKRAGKDEKVSVNYRGQINIQQAAQLPDFLNAYDYALLYNRAVENSPGTMNLPYDQVQLEAIRTHAQPNLYGDGNLLDYLDKIGYTTTHSLSAHGGNRFLKYYLSGGYTNTKGLYSGVGRERFNYSTKLDATLTKGLVLSVDIIGSVNKSKNSSYTTLDAAYNFSPVDVLMFDNGMLASINGGNPLVNVLGMGGYIKDEARMNTIIANLNYDIPWVKGLSLYARVTLDNNSRIEKTFSKPVTLYTYNKEQNTFEQDPNTIYPTAKVTIEQTDRFTDNQLYEAGIRYNRTFMAKHDVGAMLVANYQQQHNQYMTGENLDASIYPETIGNAVLSRLLGSESYNQRASLIGRLNYGYDYRYFLEASFRVDGSTYFHPDHRWGIFPAVSASWVLSNEEFFKNWKQNVISNVKFRASTGILGNDGMVGEYSYLLNFIESTREGYGFNGNYRPGIIMATGNYPNPELTWGKTHDYNIAGDFGFWNNRIALTYEYFWRFETDKITAAPSYLYPPSTGVNGNIPNVNFSKLKAWGWDLTLSHRNTINKFKYNVAVTLSKSNDKYIDFGDESMLPPNLRRTGRSSLVWKVYEADGLFQSQEEIDAYMPNMSPEDKQVLAPGDIKYKDKNNDGKLTTADMIYVKNSSRPDFNLSIRLGASYKGFFINAMLQGAMGYQQNIKELYTNYSGSLQRFQKYHLTETWTENNPDAKLPRIKFATANDNNRLESTFWIRDCNYLRLKTLSVGYSFQSELLKRMHLESASIAFQGSNLFTWSSIKDLDMDPESLRGYPIQRSYGLTLNLGF